MLSKGFLSEALGFVEGSLLEELSEAAEMIEIKRGQQVAELGTPPQYAYFLISGVFRAFYINGKGEDVTDFFVYRSGALMVSSYDLKSPAPVNVVAASELQCIRISMERFQGLLHQYHEVACRYNEYLTYGLREHTQLKQVMNKYDCEQRYQWFLKSYPGLIQQIWLKDIASFLDMTPVTLSRIRRKMRGGGQCIGKSLSKFGQKLGCDENCI
ncbi:Crp/Fnr family transcriptional regulator [Ihubacter sp. mB4P-1]|uniref:Crp/Fnr family transcriptional regulator n=1 Tax=Ihubacter sp. mB4P-1 TaxID=3242370 RepID=UPI003C7DF875